MRKKFFIVLSVLFLLLVSITISKAQIPEPYDSCGEVSKPEWHSLRPYQASPCKVPIFEDEQALLCGNDLIVQDTFPVPPPQPVSCNGPSSCPGTAMCRFEVPRKFELWVNAYESRYPIAGNTELTEPAESYDNPSFLQYIASALKKELRLTPQSGDLGFSTQLPPDINNYPEFDDYYEAYREWRGDICFDATIPFINTTIRLCVDDPTNPNFYSELLPNVPYSSTEDRIGKIEAEEKVKVLDTNIDTIDPNPPNTIWTPPARDQRHATLEAWESALFFPHMEEDVELTTLLQSTYLSPEILSEEQTIGDTTKPRIQNHCKIVNVRKNPGDQLFGEVENINDPDGIGQPDADVEYTAKFECECRFDQYCRIINCCTKYAIFYTTIKTYTPMIDELWAKTVAGNASVVKKIFPKIEDGAPLDEIVDTPGSADVIHGSRNKSGWGDVITISTERFSELYFPHLGGIYDYFLKGIQQALRPDGYGGGPINLTYNNRIPKVASVNEYISWYLNGTEYRAENDPLSVDEEDDWFKIVNLTGPLNKLLSQHSQWRAETKINSVSYQEDTLKLGEATQTQGDKAQSTRHNQIAACYASLDIPILGGTLGGFPTYCDSAYLDQLPPPDGTGASPIPSPGANTPNCDPRKPIPARWDGQMKSAFIDVAGRWPAGRYPDCAGQDLAEECYNEVVAASIAAGVNPAMSLTIWLNESDASNYCISPTIQDFGINDPALYQNFWGQLDTWLQLPFAGTYMQCRDQCDTVASCRALGDDMFPFLSRFRGGGCNLNADASNPGYVYYQALKPVWQIVVSPIGSCLDGNGNYSIDWPTDNSCP